MKMPSLLQRRFVWNVGQWPMLTALISLYLFWAGGWIVALPLAVASLVTGLRSRFTFYSLQCQRCCIIGFRADGLRLLSDTAV